MKVTYVTLAGNDEAHVAYEEAVPRVRASLGATHRIEIDGSPIGTGAGAAMVEDRSPIDTTILIGRFPQAGPGDVARALAAARRAFPGWSGRPWRERLGILRTAADRISDHASELAALMSIEVGKNRLEAYGDAYESADLLRYYCDQFEEAGGFVKPLGRLLPGEETSSVLRPYGVWGVISPFNFPLALAAGMSGGALAAGNTVVFKPASDAALTGLRLHEIFVEAGLPAGVFNIITGSGGVLGRAFLEAGLDGLVFTGSRQVGFELMASFARDYPRPVIVEMGGKNPAVVTARADIEKAAQGVARSAFGYGGQKCSACSRAFVDRSVYDRFMEALVETTRGMRIGDPIERETYLGPLINEKAAAVWTLAIDEARRDGRVILGAAPSPELSRAGHFVSPAIVDRLAGEHRLWREELFVPLVCVAPVASLEEAIERANRTEYGLTAGIFSEDEEEVRTFFDRIEAGVTYANRRTGATTGAWPGVQSFCGWKASGSTGKGGCGPYYVQQFLREQSRTIVRDAR
ncbi:MAG TPA: aldehyde dehydrogenase family protein [Candidatus Polarisedimenticolia bacterium]|jgi:1-pyrroline-5-carboxylate dehydrogenase